MTAISKNYPLKNLTTIETGGPADYFLEVKNESDIFEAIDFADKNSLPIFILGRGSNVLISDNGFKGLVIHNKIFGVKTWIKDEAGFIKSGAGEDWDNIVKISVEKNWAGMECLSGIPGTVGASPIQNIGAYGQSLEDIIEEITAISIADKKEVIFSKNDCKFKYRKSIFNSKDEGKYIVTSVTFKLRENGLPQIIYQDLKNIFSSKIPTLLEVRKAVFDIRNKKGMLVSNNSKYETLKSAGSFFKNPVVSIKQFNLIKKKSSNQENKKWFWLQKSGEIKISAARLIQESGFYPGYKSGNVGISPKHTLAIINLGDGKSDEIIKLAKEIQDKVLDKFEIILKPEVRLIGYRDNLFL